MGDTDCSGFISTDGIWISDSDDLRVLAAIAHELIHRAGFRRVLIRPRQKKFDLKLDAGYGRMNQDGSKIEFEGLNEGITDLLTEDFWTQTDGAAIGVSTADQIDILAYPYQMAAMRMVIGDLARRRKETTAEVFAWIRTDYFSTATRLPLILRETYGEAIWEGWRDAMTAVEPSKLTRAMRLMPNK